MRASLKVTLYGEAVAELLDGDRGALWRWTAGGARRWGLGSRIVSQILPVQRAGETAGVPAARAFLAGLLPEGNVRSHMAFAAGVVADDVFGLIRAYGRDTAGALIFAPTTDLGEPPRWEPVDESQIAGMLRHALAGYSPQGLQSTSLAGVQPKIALFRGAGVWMRCVSGAPSTHILKVGQPAGSPLADVIDTEAACLDLARQVGLGSVEATIETFEDLRALVVTRFDRRVLGDGSVRRTHQEDAAQALGIDTSDLDRKFQYGKRLPSLRAIADVLRAGGSEPDRLLSVAAFNIAVGNTDAHAKNTAILRPARGPARLADAYDISMHGHHQLSSGRSAMDVNGKQVMADITLDDLEAEGRSWGLPPIRATRATYDTVARLHVALGEIDRGGFPGVVADAWATVERRVTGLLGGQP